MDLCSFNSRSDPFFGYYRCFHSSPTVPTKNVIAIGAVLKSGAESGIGAHVCKFSSWEKKVARQRVVQGLPGLQSETYGYGWLIRLWFPLFTVPPPHLPLIILPCYDTAPRPSPDEVPQPWTSQPAEPRAKKLLLFLSRSVCGFLLQQ